MQVLLKQLVGLTDEQRLDARDRARQVVIRAIGDKPQRESFLHATVSQYPQWFTLLIAGIMVVVFVAAAMPSLFRLYTAGREYFLHGITEENQAAIVGITTFLLAESLVILSTISARVFFTGRARWLFAVPVFMGLAMALVGNWHITRPEDLFGWLETIVPPLAVLFIAFIGERLILDSIETRHANERAFQQALKDYQVATAEPEKSPRWRAAYANALRDKLIEANGSGSGAKARKELIAGMQSQDWRPLVWREMQADQWFDVTTETVEAQQPNPTPAARVIGPPQMEMISNGNGHYSETG